MAATPFYIGLMSGTSLDGIDGIITDFRGTSSSAYIPFPATLKNALMALQSPGMNEIHREALAANQLSRLYAACVAELLRGSGISAAQVKAIGAHGQTIRHLPTEGYTRQINNPALVAELTGIDVIADFRSRDIAAGGQGAPLVPAFHRSVFGSASHTRAIVNIGGISNISVLGADGSVTGFDTGPGNVLMDAWIHHHQGKAYDANGEWASSGKVIDSLLTHLRDEDFFRQAPPKSTGRDLFHLSWLNERLAKFPDAHPQDVQATLAALTARGIADAIHTYAPECDAVFICGGGAFNAHLMQCLSEQLPQPVTSTDSLGISPTHVEAFAFAWLAQRFCDRQFGNVPAVTGAKGERLLGALYPA